MQLKSLSLFGRLLSPTVVLFAVAITPAGVASAQTVSPRPCDLFAFATPCVAAFSTTRALYSTYTGPLYQVMRQSDKTYTNIGVLPDGYAKAVSQDTFCANTSCVITRLFDQSPNHNDLTPAPPGGAARGPGPNGYDSPPWPTLSRQPPADTRSTASPFPLAPDIGTIPLQALSSTVSLKVSTWSPPPLELIRK